MKILFSSDLHGDMLAYARFMELLKIHDIGILSGDLLDEFLPISDAQRFGLIEEDYIEEIHDEDYDQVRELEIAIQDALKNKKSINRIGLEKKKDEIIKLVSSIVKPVLFVIGNHDIACWKSKMQFIDIENKPITINGYTFLGVRYRYRGINSKIVNVRKLKSKFNNSTILVSHIPPYGILDLTERKDKIGNADLLKLIKKFQPLYCIFGHVHEMFGNF